ncbi:hypothetical protein FLONG3_2869 [Fusarium longipes]|uniref:Uncharacterized protein n=1 Tax=Fusarium longipes TaxID=694270 RepID=A0A395T2J8_9HYPO|nr:hypothetical protein FLONG3_2869 [Fusarium longipes]
MERPADEEQNAHTQPFAVHRYRHPRIGQKSFHGLCVEHANFQVSPMRWTERHLEILNCKFRFIADTHDTRLSEAETKMSEMVLLFDTSYTRTAKLCCEYLLELHSGNSPLSVVAMPLLFHFGKFTYTLYHCIALNILPCRSDNTRVVAGFSQYRIDEQRHTRFTTPSNRWGFFNSPVRRRYARKLLELTPNDWRNDPYILAVLLGLAQSRYEEDDQDGVYKTRLLVTNFDEDSRDAYVYKADIPKQLVESLHDPLRTIDDFEFPDIEYTNVSYQPFWTFSERVEKHFDVIPVAPRGVKRSFKNSDSSVAKVQK